MLSAARVISCSLFMSCDVICSLSLLYMQIASGSHTYPRTLKDTTNLTPPAQPSPASLPTHLPIPHLIYIRYSEGVDPHRISSCLIRAPPSPSFSCQLAPPHRQTRSIGKEGMHRPSKHLTKRRLGHGIDPPHRAMQKKGYTAIPRALTEDT